MSLRFAKLTRPAIRALPIGGKISEHTITAKKLGNGDVVYSVGAMIDGQRIHRVVGKESAGVTREQAEVLVQTLKTRMREGRFDLPAGRKNYRTVADAAVEYLTRLENTNGKNLKPKRQHLRQHLVPALGSERIDKLSEFRLQRYRKARLDGGASDATINREIATLSHLFSRAVAWKWIKRDALPVFPKARESRKPITILDDVQSEALMAGAISDQDPRLWLFVAFGLNAAMRHREILKVRYDQIDFASRRIFIPEAKAGEREQPITAALSDALIRQRRVEADPDGWVFPSVQPKQSHYGHRTNMARPFERAVIRAKLDPDKVTPHTMRHTAITRLVRAGVDLPTIQKISGHRTLAMILRYTHIHGLHVDAAIGALDRAIPLSITHDLHTPVSSTAPKATVDVK